MRSTLERPDVVTASAVSARDNISRAFADRIRETETAGELRRVAEDVLPQIEKFLESPEEKRLRRLRAGVVMAFIGLGATSAGILASLSDKDFIALIIPGLVAFFIGLGIILNGLVFTLPRKGLPNRSADALAQNVLDEQSKSAIAVDTAGFSAAPNMLLSSERHGASASVTEHTTKHLAEKH